MADWQTLSTKTVYKNKWLRLDEDTVINPLGNKAVYSHMELNSDYVSVVAVDDEKNIFLTEQYRYPIKTLSWETVGGQTEGEEILTAAARELLEETGLKAGSLEIIGSQYLDASASGTKGTVVLARDLTKVTTELDPLDGITQSRAFPIPEINQMIKDGGIRAPHTIAAFHLALLYIKPSL
jgi:8-oxo-dGTP pyrophosphatase MutT (NUDIX family)